MEKIRRTIVSLFGEEHLTSDAEVMQSQQVLKQ